MTAVTRIAVLTIANAGTVSNAYKCTDHTAFGLQMPAAFTGTTITFQVSADSGTTFQALYDDSGANQVSMSVAASRSYDLPAALTAWTHFKIVSGSSEGAQRLLTVVGKAA